MTSKHHHWKEVGMPWESAVHQRDELYEAVWSEPKQQLAKKLGISDVALGRACKKMRVPVPGRGYWARLASGQRLPKVALPRLRSGDMTEYSVYRWREGPGDPEAERPNKAPLPPGEADKIPVPAVLHHLHPLLKKHLDSFGQMEGRFADFLKSHTCVALWVSPESLDRALRIMSTLFEALEARGGRIEVIKHEPSSYSLYHAKPSRTGVWFGEFFLPFSLTEETKVVLTPPPPPEAPPKRASRWDPEPYSRPHEPTKVFQPNGKLIFHHEGRVYRHASNVADGKRYPLEERLHEIVNAILDDAEQARLAEIESQRRAAEAAIENKRREEEERLRRIEEARRFDLWSRVEDFTLICRAKEYILSVEGWARATGVDLQLDSEMSRWLEWARAYVSKQEQEAVETVLKKKRGPEPEAPRRHWDPEPKPPKAWGYWARTYKGW